MALEVALSVQQELQVRWEDTDRLRRQQVERARYEAELLPVLRVLARSASRSSRSVPVTRLTSSAPRRASPRLTARTVRRALPTAHGVA